MYILVRYGMETSLYARLITKDSPDFKTNPTLATGDIQLSKDGGAYANITASLLPTASRNVKIDLSIANTQCKIGCIDFVDAAGSEWENQNLTFATYGDPSAYYPDLSSIVTATITDAISKISTTNTNVTSINSTVNNIDSTVNTIDTNVDTINTNVSDIETDIVWFIGNGEHIYTNTVLNHLSAPVENADVFICSDIAGTSIIAATHTNSLGEFSFRMAVGTYYLVIAHPDYYQKYTQVVVS